MASWEASVSDIVERLRAQFKRAMILHEMSDGTFQDPLRSEAADEIERLRSRAERLEAALREARSIVEKWCHYQGNAPELFAQYLGPIDAALETAPSEGGDDE